MTTCVQAPPLAVARTLLAPSASWNMKETRYIGLFDITAAFVQSSPMDELSVLIPPARIVQPGQGLLLRRALYGTRTASKLWARTYSRAVMQRTDGLRAKCFQERCSTMPRPCVAVTHFLWTHLWKGLGTVKATPRNHFETKRLALVGPGRASEGRFLTRTIRRIEHNTLLHVVC